MRAIAVTPDGTRLASACDDQKVRIWDTSNVMADIAPDAPDAISDAAPAAPGTEESLMFGGELGVLPWSEFAGHAGTVRFVEFMGVTVSRPSPASTTNGAVPRCGAPTPARKSPPLN